MKHLKSEFDKLTFKEFFTFVLAAVCIIAGIVLVFISLYMPPQGEIHPTVITLFGIMLSFAGAILGFSMHTDAQIEKFKAEIRKYLGEDKTPSIL